MPKPAEFPIERIHIQIYKEDLALLQTYFADNIGVSPAIRKIVRSWLETNNLLLKQRAEDIEDLVV